MRIKQLLKIHKKTNNPNENELFIGRQIVREFAGAFLRGLTSNEAQKVIEVVLFTSIVSRGISPAVAIPAAEKTAAFFMETLKKLPGGKRCLNANTG